MQRMLLPVIGGLLVIGLAWFTWPAPIDPAYWDEPPIPEMTGPLAPNDILATAEIIRPEGYAHSEDFAFAPDGSIYAGTLFGTIQHVSRGPSGEWQVEEIMRVSDRALLGIQWMKTLWRLRRSMVSTPRMSAHGNPALCRPALRHGPSVS